MFGNTYVHKFFDHISAIFDPISIKLCIIFIAPLLSGQCPAGYYCVGGTNTANPTDLTAHKGAQCPKGNFCAAGKPSPELCAAGTFQDNIGLGILRYTSHS